MESGRWSKIEELFNAACALSSVNRDVFLHNLKREDYSLCREIIDLLELDEQPHELLDHPLKKFDITNLDQNMLGDLNFKI